MEQHEQLSEFERRIKALHGAQHTLETRVGDLLLAYNSVRKANTDLKAQVVSLQSAYASLQVEHTQLKGRYSTLATAKMMEFNDSEISNARSNLNKMIREVDKCIALLEV